MGFYGNIKDIEKNSSFVFDKIYANRQQMDQQASTDGVYVGRYVLIEYDTDASSLDYKKVYENTQLNKVNGYKVLFNTTSFEEVNKIIYSDKNSESESGLISTITSGTMVYTIENDKNVYYTCAGYFTLDKNDLVTIVVNGKTNTFTDRTLSDSYKTDIQYALFSELAASDLDSQTNYAKNYNIDVAYAKTLGTNISGHAWDSTVWQKTIVGSKDKYVMVAELNTVVPTFDISADAPTMMPITPHFDAASTDVYYKLHWQPQWGMRVQLADAQHSDGTKVNISDETTTWIREVYNKDTDKSTSYYYSIENKWVEFNPVTDDIAKESKAHLPAAIYYNKAGFDAQNRYISTLDNSINILPTGRSQTPYGANQTWSDTQYNSHIPGQTKSAEDTQEISMILPSIGNAIGKMWDIVYGNGIGATAGKNDVPSQRAMDISWKETPADGNDPNRLQLIKTTEKNGTYTYDVADVETLAGSINSVHDLMGMIIKEDSSDSFNAAAADADSIYLLKDKRFYRKAEDNLNSLIQLEEDKYEYREVENLSENEFNKAIYYISDGESFKEYTGDYDKTLTYYQKYVENGLEGPFVVTTFDKIIQDNDLYLYKNGNGDYIYDTSYKDNQTYYTIDTTKCDKVTLATDYEPNKFYYKVGNDYFLDTALKQAIQEIEYELADKVQKVDGRKIYRSSTYFYKVTSEKVDNSDVYIINNFSFNKNVKNFLLSRPTSADEVKATQYTNESVLVYPRRIKANRNVEIDGVTYELYELIYIGEKEYSLAYKVSETEYYLYTTGEKVDLTKIQTIQRAYNYILEEPAQYIKYNGSIDNIEYDVNGSPYFYGIVPYDAHYETVNEIYILKQLNDLIEGLDSADYYQLKGNDYYYLSKEDTILPKYTDPTETIYYLPVFNKHSDNLFYQTDKYYYQGEDKKSWYKDKAGVPTTDREYYSMEADAAQVVTDLNETLKKQKVYEPGKYYLKLSEYRYVLDYSTVPQTGEVYYSGVNDFYVFYDPENLLPKGAYWNSGLPIRHGMLIAQLNSTKSYTMKELVGFARTLNTIHGLILQINNFLEYGNTDTRDTSTVQGSLNKLNDIIAKFEILDYAQFMVTDAYGRMHTAPAADDEWITTYVNPDVKNPKVHIHHNTQDINTNENSGTNLNDPATNTITLKDIEYDAAGHITADRPHVYTLPFGFKTITTNGRGSSENENATSNPTTTNVVADNTQDTLGVNSGNKWIRIDTNANNDTLTFSHDIHMITNSNKTDTNLNTTKADTITIQDTTYDKAGHVTANQSHTYTLPFGFKTINADSGSYTAVNTQDSFSIKTSDDWLSTTIDKDSNVLNIAHDVVSGTLEATTQDKSNPSNNNFVITTYNFDDKGHKNASSTETITLPYRFKQVTADDKKTFTVGEQQTFAITTEDNWLSTKIVDGSGVSIIHDAAQTATNTKGLLAAASPKFGGSFVVPKVGIDTKGHTSVLDEYSVTLPKPSYIADTTGGNVITGITLNSEEGKFTETKTSVGALALGTYTAQTKAADISKNDTIAVAISKNAYAISAEVTNRNKAVEDVISAYEKADTSLNTKITTEITNRTNAINSLKTELEGKIDTNKTNSEAADNSLSGRIDTLEKLNISTKFNSYDSSIGTLQSDVQSLKDLNLSAKIASLEEEITSLKQRIAALESTTEEETTT